MIDWEKEVEDRLHLTKKEKASGRIPFKYMDSLAMMLIAEKLDDLVVVLTKMLPENQLKP
jgi:hypothetical protein